MKGKKDSILLFDSMKKRVADKFGQMRDEITGKLEALGYSVGQIGCSVEKDLNPTAIKQGRMAYLLNRDGVDVIV